MQLINEQEMSSSIKHLGVDETLTNYRKALKSGDLSWRDFSLRTCFEQLTENGKDIIRRLQRSEKLDENMANAVSVANFSNLFSQLAYNAMLEEFRLFDFRVANLFGVVPSNFINTEEKFPGIANIGDAGKPVGEAEEISMAGVKEDWINSQEQRKFGLIVPVTREALVVNDRIGMLMERVKNVAYALALGREKEAAAVVVNNNGAVKRDINAQVIKSGVPYNWKGSLYSVYQSSATNSPFYNNVIASNGLVDHQNINSAYTTLAAIVDPYTGEYLADQGKYTLLCTPTNAFAAQKIKESIQYRGLSASANYASNVSSGSPVIDFDVVVSKGLATALNDASLDQKTWFLGDFGRAIKWVRHLDIVTEEALPNAGLSFSRDIMMQFRALRYETPAIFQPRVICKNTP